MAPELRIPEAPNFPGLPASVREEWRKRYASAFERAQKNHPNEPTRQHQVASTEANRIFDVQTPQSYAEAMKLEPWQCLLREDSGGKLAVVLIDGRKFVFDAPVGPAAKEKK